ncbi:His-Xaa-Ser system radical SAM maturase HxsB [Candidatus Woesearchaeota archaeon]|nr:MAG: His-Xaa-Ser system radical SAM maturase HxsB [Candidatus Woesearchaeota archaeon]
MSKAYEMLSHRVEKLNGFYLVTNDFGGFVLLDSKEFDRFRQGLLDEKLYNSLEEGGLLVTNYNKQDIVNMYRYHKKHLFQGPSLHIVIPTKRCSQNCVYCHSPTVPADRAGFDMTIKTAKQVVDFIFQSPSGFITIEFQGGEPLLNFDVVKYIVTYAKEVNKKRGKILKFTIVTNLVHMDSEKLDFMVANEVWPCTSLDGPEVLHNKNRGNGYSALKRWIPILQKRLKYRLSGIAVVTKHSLKYPKEIVDEYLKFGFTRLWVQPFHPLGRGKKNYKELRFSVEEYIKFWKALLDYIVKEKKKIHEVETTFLVRKSIFGENPLFLDLQSPCGAVINQLTYDYNGDIYTCDEGRMVEEDLFKIGHVTQAYEDVVNSGGVCSIIKLSLNDTLASCNRCAFKPFCGVCPVLTYGEFGTPIPRANTFWCKLRKAQFRFIFEAYFNDRNYRRIFQKWAKTKDL